MKRIPFCRYLFGSWSWEGIGGGWTTQKRELFQLHLFQCWMIFKTRSLPLRYIQHSHRLIHNPSLSLSAPLPSLLHSCSNPLTFKSRSTDPPYKQLELSLSPRPTMPYESNSSTDRNLTISPSPSMATRTSNVFLSLSLSLCLCFVLTVNHKVLMQWPFSNSAQLKRVLPRKLVENTLLSCRIF